MNRNPFIWMNFIWYFIKLNEKRWRESIHVGYPPAELIIHQKSSESESPKTFYSHNSTFSSSAITAACFWWRLTSFFYSFYDRNKRFLNRKKSRVLKKQQLMIHVIFVENGLKTCDNWYKTVLRVMRGVALSYFMNKFRNPVTELSHGLL